MEFYPGEPIKDSIILCLDGGDGTLKVVTAGVAAAPFYIATDYAVGKILPDFSDSDVSKGDYYDAQAEANELEESAEDLSNSGSPDAEVAQDLANEAHVEAAEARDKATDWTSYDAVEGATLAISVIVAGIIFTRVYRRIERRAAAIRANRYR